MQGDKILLELLDQQKQMNIALQKNNENLVEQVTFLAQKLYGRKSEKTAALMDGQQTLPGIFNEAEVTADPTVIEPEILEQTARRSGPVMPTKMLLPACLSKRCTVQSMP